MIKQTHEKYLHRCVTLAKHGLGKTYPNPMVGAVLVYQDRIIGEAWHQKAGESHAEVLAIQSVDDKALLPQATLYVSLEPCAHQGKTPPCADLIIAQGIPRVVIGIQDVFAQVNGAGISKLRAAGVDVILADDPNMCRSLNRRFFMFHEKKRPYIVLKWAQTTDGFIDKIRTPSETEPHINKITNLHSQQWVHRWRTEEQAIMVGTQTIWKDNPRLNVRYASGNQPLRIAIDRELKTPRHYHIMDNSQPTIVFNTVTEKIEGNTHYVKVVFDQLPQQMMNFLYAQQVQSVIIEGGGATLASFIEENLWDEARIFIGNINFGKGNKAPVLTNGKLISTHHVDEDLLCIYQNIAFDE